ncbi:MAG: Pectate lyase superfamily protein [Paenibacillus sp.]|nr:Pectate lyase superfamily protein [Paenibacillus sp.]
MNAMQGINVKWFGAKGDGVTDDSDTINAVLQQFANVYLPPEHTYCITKPIIVPDGRALYSTGNGATIKMQTVNTAGIEVGQQSSVDTLTIIPALGNTSEEACGVKIRSTPTSTRARIRNVSIKGSDFTSNGIYANALQHYVAFTVIENVFCERLKNAIRLEATPPAYVNGTLINNIIIRSTIRGFYIGKGSEANLVNNIQYNAGQSAVEAIHAETSYNQFNGWFYDLGVNGYSDQLASFSGTAEGNMIRSAAVYQSNWKITDTTPTKNNYVQMDNSLVHEQIALSSYMPHAFLTSADHKKWGYWFRYKPYEGEQDNILAYADKINIVTNDGVPLDGGELGKAFDPFGYLSTDKPLWKPGANQRAVVTITIREPDTTAKRLDFMQVVFSAGAEAKSIKFEYYDPADSSWKLAKEITNNNKRFAYWHMDVQGVPRAAMLRFTLGEPAVPATGIKVERFVARMLCSTGLTFVPRGGGTVVGDIDFYSSAVGPVLTTPDGTKKYRLWVNNDGELKHDLI